MAEVIEKHRYLVVRSPMRTGMRVFLGLFAFFPLIAPYELLIKPNWDTVVNPFFLFFAAISLGALSVSAFFAWAAIAGISSTMTFDKGTKTFTFTAEAPVRPRHQESYPLDTIRSVEVETHESSDSGPSYSVRVELDGGKSFNTASAWQRPEIDDARDRIANFLFA